MEERALKIISYLGLGLTAFFLGLSFKLGESFRVIDMAILFSVITVCALLGAFQAEVNFKLEMLVCAAIDQLKAREKSDKIA